MNNSSNKKIINFDNAKMKIEKNKCKITDAEINSLFLGLVKLIKKSAINEINLQLKKECEFATKNYTKILAIIEEKNKQISILKDQNATLNKALNLKIGKQQSKR